MTGADTGGQKPLASPRPESSPVPRPGCVNVEGAIGQAENLARIKRSPAVTA
ncbi:MAG: hypothetical protein ABI838_07635 [Chloroflexota bacterium]